MLFQRNRNSEVENYVEGSVITDEQIGEILPDLKELIWFGDGPCQNYDNQDYIICADIRGYEFEVAISKLEPSVIFTGLPVETEGEEEKLRKLRDDFYVSLSPLERGKYWKVLQDPRESKVRVDYAFILLHGLERHLLTGDSTNASKVLLWMRQYYGDRGFQYYSANALMMSALIRNRRDLAEDFFNSLNTIYYYRFSPDLYLWTLFGLDIPLTADMVMILFRHFGFSIFKSVHLRNLRDFPEVFLDSLRKAFREKFGGDGLLLTDVISSEEVLGLEQITVPVFSGRAFVENEIPIPKMTASGFAAELTALVDHADEMARQARSAMYKQNPLRQEIRDLMHPENK